MKAIRYKGGTDPAYALYETDVRVPKPKAKQVLVKVKASSLNIIDFERFKNKRKMTFFAKAINLVQGKNVILGGEVSGLVVEVGEQVKSFRVGDIVFGPTIGLMQYGGWAEFALCDSETLALKPNTLSYEEAAVIPLSCLTALGVVSTAKVNPGDSVLLYGASGGVGLYTLQVLKAKGANVTAVCSRRNVKLAQTFNADEVICYQDDDFTKCNQLFDIIISVNGFQPLCSFKKLLNERGQYFVVGNVKQALSAIVNSFLSKNVHFFSSAIGQDHETMQKLLRLIEGGDIKPFIDSTYQLNEVVKAINYVINEHTQGKVALKIDYEGENDNG